MRKLYFVYNIVSLFHVLARCKDPSIAFHSITLSLDYLEVGMLFRTPAILNVAHTLWLSLYAIWNAFAFCSTSIPSAFKAIYS